MSAMTLRGADTKSAPREKTKVKTPHRWKLFILPYQILFGHIGKLAIIALYFILLQILHGQHTTLFGAPVTLPDVKGTWDHLLTATTANGGFVHVMSQATWDPIRHLIRSVYEGIFGIVLFKQIGFNVVKYRAKLKETPDKLSLFTLKHLNRFVVSPYQDHPVTPLQYLVLPLIITLASIPGLGIGYALVQVLHHFAHAAWLSPHISAHPSFAARFYADGYDAVVVGIFAGLLAGRSYNAVLYSNLQFFARRRVAKGKKAHLWHPPAYRDLVKDLSKHDDSQERAQEALALRSKWVAPILLIGSVVTFALACFGYYVIRYIA